MKSRLLKAAGLIGGLTLISRILGMSRDILSAKSFGTTWQWDALIYAFMLPNFMRRLVGEGAISSAFIPIYAEVMEKEGEPAAFRFGNIVFTLLSCGLIGFLAFLEFFLFLALKNFSLAPELHLIGRLLQVLFPYLFFIALSALAAGIQNCHHRFFSASLSPLILDLVWIAAVLWICPLGGPRAEDRVFWLALCLLISGVFQLAAQVPSLFQLGYFPRFEFDLRHPGLRKIGKLFLPSLLGFAVMQINVLVDMTMGLWVGPGANSSLWYGNRLMQFPLGVFAIAMGTAVLPALSRQTARKEIEEAKKTLSFALRTIFFIILPSTVGLIALRTPIVRLLFERGEFDAVSTARTSFVVLCYTIGLFAYSGQKIIVTGFYSLQDTKTPMKVGAAALVMNIILNVLLMIPLKEGGLALATSISGIFNFLFLVYLFDRRVAAFPRREIFASSVKIFGASLGMGGFAWIAFEKIYPLLGGGETFRLLAGVFSSMGASVLIYLGLCLLFRVSEVREAVRWFRESQKKSEVSESVGEEPF